MKKLILIVCALSVVAGIGAKFALRDPRPSTVAPDPRYPPSAMGESVVKDTKDFTVLISNESMEGISRGTGILIDSMTVLTCAHVLPADRSTKNLWIYPHPGAQVVHAKLKFVNYPNDLALLELTTPVSGHKVPTFAKKVEVGEPIVAVGNIQGFMLWFVSYGIISGEHDRWVLTDATIRGGNSGGPWVNAKGEIVALTDVGWNDSKGNSVGISGGVPAKDLQEFLAHAMRKKPDLIYALTGQ